MKKIHIAEEFSRYPAGRYIKDGPFSGELFRKKFLEPNLKAQETITIDLDGTRGYGSSFLEEAFGGLVRQGHSKEDLKKRLKINTENQSLVTEIFDFIENADVQS